MPVGCPLLAVSRHSDREMNMIDGNRLLPVFYRSHIGGVINYG